MKCELGAALCFVIRSGRELTVARGDCGQSSGDHSQVPQITVVSKIKKLNSRFPAVALNSTWKSKATRSVSVEDVRRMSLELKTV